MAGETMVNRFRDRATLLRRVADADAERDRLRRFAEAVITPCEWGPFAHGVESDEDISVAAERFGIFREVLHAQPCTIEGCECDGSPTLLRFAWAGPPPVTER